MKKHLANPMMLKRIEHDDKNVIDLDLSSDEHHQVHHKNVWSDKTLGLHHNLHNITDVVLKIEDNKFNKVMKDMDLGSDKDANNASHSVSTPHSELESEVI